MFNTSLYNASPYAGIMLASQPMHIIIMGKYQVTTGSLNRAYFTGKDTTGNPVIGYHEDDNEIDLVGERLHFSYDSTITTNALASQVATAVLDKARLQQRIASILVPPHCGIELWDVISVLDPLAAQSSQLYRVIGIRLLFNADNAAYHQQLTLGAV